MERTHLFSYLAEHAKIEGWRKSKSSHEFTIDWHGDSHSSHKLVTIATQITLIGLNVFIVNEKGEHLDSYAITVEWNESLPLCLKSYTFETQRAIKRATHGYLQQTLVDDGPLREAAMKVIQRWSDGDLAQAVRELDEVLNRQRQEEIDRLMENEEENEHLLIAIERKQSANTLEDVLEEHGLGFVSSTLARLCELRSDEAETPQEKANWRMAKGAFDMVSGTLCDYD